MKTKNKKQKETKKPDRSPNLKDGYVKTSKLPFTNLAIKPSFPSKNTKNKREWRYLKM